MKDALTESWVSEFRMLAVFAALTLGLGVFLIAQALYLTHRSQAAQSWSRVPCVIKQSSVSVFDDTVEIDIAYGYEYGGRPYTARRVHLMPESIQIGDGSWEKQFVQDHPVDLRTVCFVNPRVPSQAVLDRTRGFTASRALLMISFVPLCIGVGLGRAAVRGRLCVWLSNRIGDRASMSSPPRVIRRLSLIALRCRSHEPLWVFPLGLSLVFVAFDGAGLIHDSVTVQRRTKRAKGIVTGVSKLSHKTFGESWYEFRFTYSTGEDEEHDGSSAAMGRLYSDGDTVDIEYHPDQPEHALVVGARPTAMPRWIGIAGLGLALAFLWYIQFGPNSGGQHELKLLRDGRMVQAIGSPAGSKKTPSHYNCRFTVDGKQYVFQLAVTARHSRLVSSGELTVLYDPQEPEHNTPLVGLEHHLCREVDRVVVLAYLNEVAIALLALLACAALLIVSLAG